MISENDFLEHKHDYVFRWYQQADTKAQVVLGFTGIFLSLLIGTFVPDSSKLATAPPLPWLFWLVVVLHLTAVILAACALWSRGVFGGADAGVVFFGRIANFGSADAFSRAILAERSQQDYDTELAENIYLLSRNVRLKHRLIDFAVVASGLAWLATLWLLVDWLTLPAPGV